MTRPLRLERKTITRQRTTWGIFKYEEFKQGDKHDDLKKPYRGTPDVRFLLLEAWQDR